MREVLEVLASGAPAGLLIGGFGPWLLGPALLSGGVRIIYRAMT